MMVLITLSFAALVIAALMHLLVGVVIIKALAIFLGLEGTILLALALSPPRDEMNIARPPRILRGLLWEFKEGSGLNYPIHYNPVFFYGGLLLLAAAFVVSAIPG